MDMLLGTSPFPRTNDPVPAVLVYYEDRQIL